MVQRLLNIKTCLDVKRRVDFKLKRNCFGKGTFGTFVAFIREIWIPVLENGRFVLYLGDSRVIRESGHVCKTPGRPSVFDHLLVQYSRHFSLTWNERCRGKENIRALSAGTSALAAIMPPKKKGGNEPSKKAEQKKKEKIIEVINWCQIVYL